MSLVGHEGIIGTIARSNISRSAEGFFRKWHMCAREVYTWRFVFSLCYSLALNDAPICSSALFIERNALNVHTHTYRNKCKIITLLIIELLPRPFLIQCSIRIMAPWRKKKKNTWQTRFLRLRCRKQNVLKYNTISWKMAASKFYLYFGETSGGDKLRRASPYM